MRRCRRFRAAAGTGPVPLSFAQERLWLFDQLDPGKAVYNVSRALRIRGRLDVEALGRALDTIQERHEVLRSSFPLVDGNPVQAVDAASEPPLSVVDLDRLCAGGARGGGPAHRRGGSTEALRSRGGTRAAGDAAASRPSRITFCSSPFTTSSSMAGLRHLRPRARDALRRRTWKGGRRRWLRCRSSTRILPSGSGSGCAGEVLEEAAVLLEGGSSRAAPAVPGVAHRRSRPPVQSFRGATETISIPQGLAERDPDARPAGGGNSLRDAACGLPGSAASATPGRTTSWWARPVAGRNRSDIEGLIGFFVNTLVFRTDWPAIRPSGSCSDGCARSSIGGLPPIRIFRSRDWSRSSTRSGL